MRSVLAPVALAALPIIAILPTGGDPVTTLLAVDGETPAVVGALGPPAELVAVAVSPDGALAAGAFPSAERKGRTIVRLVDRSGAPPTELEFAGTIRSLVFGGEGRVLYGLLHRSAKKRDGDAYLVDIQLDTLKARRGMRLPPSATTLARSPAGDALIVSARDEIRTVLIPGLRSGRLFRLLGDNLAVVALPRGHRILVGRADGLVLIDLDDPPGRDQMPLRETLATAESIIGIALASDGSRGLIRTGDGRTLPLWLDPLRLEEPRPPGYELRTEAAPEVPVEHVGPGAGPTEQPPVRPAYRAEAEPAGEPPAAEPSRAEPEVAKPMQVEPSATEAPAVEAEPAPVVTREPVIVPEAAVERPTAAAEPEVAAPTPHPVVVDEIVERPSEPPAEQPAERHQLYGKVVGPAASRVQAVVLFGPNTWLREAARARVETGGRWSLSGLAPGRYRVQLDAGGEHALITEPPFRIVTVEAHGSVEVPEIRALRVL